MNDSTTPENGSAAPKKAPVVASENASRPKSTPAEATPKGASDRTPLPTGSESEPSPPSSGSNAKPSSSSRNRRRRRGSGNGGSGGNASGASGGNSGSTGPAESLTASSKAKNPPAHGPSTPADTKADLGPQGVRPKIGDSRPAPEVSPSSASATSGSQPSTPTGEKNAPDAALSGGSSGPASGAKRRRRGGRGRSKNTGNKSVAQGRPADGVRSGVAKPVTALTAGDAVALADDVFEERRGKSRKGKPVGRYLMAVHVQPEATQIAILEGRALIEHYVARPSDDITQIHGNIYLGRVQNVLPGMEAAFVDIGTPKNAVLYRGDLHFDEVDAPERETARIEELLKAKQSVLCQVTKNPIMHKGARLTQEVSLPGRFVVLVPNSRTVGISKRLPDAERKRLRKIIDQHRPNGHGVIVRTAAENITGPEIERDLARLVAQWEKIAELGAKASAPALLYREPDMALRVIREELSRDFRAVVIDEPDIHRDVHEYVASVSPALAERVSYYDPAHEPLPLFEKYHVVEQLRRAIDRKVWLPSGGSLIIEHTEALTVIDVNTGKNVGSSNLEDTVFQNNLEAAEEIARQLRLRDVGGIIVIDFIDMEIKKNRAEVVRVFRDALARDKTRTQVFDISELGLVQMTRKRIGEGLLESLSMPCATCEGRGLVFDRALLRE